MESYTILSKAHMLFALLFVISMLIKVILIFKNNEAFDKYRGKTKIAEMVVTILFLALGIILMVQKGGGFHMLFWIKLGIVAAGIPLGIIGAKKHSKALVTLSFLCFFGAYGLAEVAKKKAVVQEVVVEEPSQLGTELYKVNCVACHGEDGKKGLGGASDLSASVLSEEEAKNVITNGRGGMAPYGGQMKEEEITALATYLQSLKAK
ncbi:MAG: c-type cytochrome [Bacteroidetes bacterium]|nr:c-type cytochrome [Bacteroidota bacterium]